MLIHEQAKIYRVRLPMPFELDHINCYAFKGNDGWSIIDCGLNNEASFRMWKEFMDAEGIKAGEIKGIYMTHLHVDHCGLAGRLHDLSGAPVYMSVSEFRSEERFQRAFRNGQVSDLMLKNGMPPASASKMDEFFELDLAQQLPAITVIEPGQKVTLGDLEYLVILTPGHSDGHICFYNAEFGILMSGDTILPEISPNISLWPWSIQNPVKAYLKTLELLQNLHCNVVFSAHGEPITSLAERVSAIKEIHNEKLAAVKSLAKKETTVYEAVLQIYGKNLDTINMGLAMGEIYAHLMFLYYNGEIKLSEQAGQNVFSLTD